MNNKSISPNLQQPVDRVPAGQLPSALTELSEGALNASDNVNAALYLCDMGYCLCSFDGDDE